MVPPNERGTVVEELHKTHPGICRMKALVKKLHVAAENGCRFEAESVSVQSLPEKQEVTARSSLKHPWEWLHKLWGRLHLDYASLFLGKMFLLMIDAHSKWMEVFPMKKLRIINAPHGRVLLKGRPQPTSQFMTPLWKEQYFLTLTSR